MISKRILICDDHSLFATGLAEILKQLNYSTCLAVNTEECMQLLKSQSFDVFFCDLNIDQKSGFMLFTEAKPYLLNTRSFMLTGYLEWFLIDKAEKLGFNGFLSKDSSKEQLIAAIESDPKSSFISTVKENVKFNTNETLKEYNLKQHLLSKQELKIIQFIVQGFTSKEIGELLFISKATVDTHRRNINRKLDITNISALIRFSHENNLFV